MNNGFHLAVLAALMIMIGERTALAVDYGGQAYQESLISAALNQHQLQLDPEPQGKVIERIVIVPFDVILEQEPWPQLLNAFHITTLPEVIQRELLFKEGDRWNPPRIEETARNLRNYLFLTSGRIIAARGSSPDRLVAVVVTKDRWSLRLNTSFSYVGSSLEKLNFEFSEHNLLGRTKRSTIDFGLDLATWYIGQQFRDPRLLGSRLLLAERADLIVNRNSGHLEGGVTKLSIEQPLYDLDTGWGWFGTLSYRKDIFRFFSGGAVDAIVFPSTGESLPYAFNRQQMDFKVGVTRSLGHDVKRDYSVGYRAFAHDFSIPAVPTAIQAPAFASLSAQILPRTERAGMLFVSAHFYRADFRQLLDIQTFALTEDYRLGPDITAELSYANRGLGFSSSFIQPSLTAGSTWYVADDLFNISGALSVRYQPEVTPGLDWTNGEASVRVANVSPRWGIMRVHSVIQAARRYNNLDHDFNTLGGNSNLRGYPSGYLHGANYWVANVEARTTPASLSTLHFGVATFFDVGDASDSLDTLGAHPSVGVGLRVGIPQFNHEVLRVDFGVPLETVVGQSPAYVVAQYGQAF